MAPSENSILTNYLVVPSRLGDITTFEQFRALFPRSQQSSPLVKSLYRDLQHQRNALVDRIAANIADELRHSKVLRREAARARREAEAEVVDDEIEIERALFGPGGSSSQSRHTLQSAIPEMDAALSAMESEMESLEAEEAALLESVQQAMGGLSDLRYGKLKNANLRQEVLQSLETFQDTCRTKS